MLVLRLQLHTSMWQTQTPSTFVVPLYFISPFQCLTEHFTSLETQNLRIGEFYEVHKRHSTDCQALKDCSVGGQTAVHLFFFYFGISYYLA